MKSACPPRQDWKTLLVFSLLATTAYPQAVSQPASSASEKERAAAPIETVSTDAPDDEIIALTPFEVSSTTDRGYQATETLAGTRIRTNLADVGSAISVVTKEFMKDIGATDNSTLLQYTTNAEVAGTRGTYAGLGNGTTVDESSSLRAPGGAQRVRGLASADNTRDYFVSDIPWDSYNVDRIDIQRGPNSILFGLGSPAGIVNATLRNAEFRNTGNAEVRFGSYDTIRASLDFNQMLIPKVLAFRFDGLWNDEKYKQNFAFQKDKRYYGALRFEPKLFKRKDFLTSIKAKYEHGDIDANRPRIVPPADSITPWFRPVDTASLTGGMGKQSVDNAYNIGANAAAFNPWLSSVANQQQPIWFIDGSTANQQRIYGGYVNTGARNNDGSIRGTGESLLGQRYSEELFGLASMSTYANNARLPGYQYGQYRQTTLQDPSVFDFYNNLIDGPTKSEFEKWDAYNISLTQTAWDDRLGIDLSYDRQEYKRGGQALLGNPTITIDVLQTLQDLTPNPNYGRPYIVGGPGSGNSYESDREYLRASLFAELRASDLLEKNSLLETILGKHRFTGVASDETYETENLAWRMYAHSQDWAAYWNRTNGANSDFKDRAPLAAIYLGPSIINAASAAGANVSGITAPVTLNDGGVYHFASTWTGGTNYATPWAVPSNLNPIYFAPPYPPANPNLTEASNPANYIGWNTNVRDNLLRYNDGADSRLLTNAQKTRRETKSYAATWQGYWWRDALVTTLGWRSDEVKGKQVLALGVPTNRLFLNLGDTGISSNNNNTGYTLPAEFPPTQIFKESSTSGGAVLHLNKLFKSQPLPLNVSLSYNKSDNFQVTDTRRDVYGKVISNPTGSTKDYGVLLSTKDGRYSLRAVKYETTVKNANTQLDLGGLAGAVTQGLKFRNVFLYRMSGYTWDTREQTNLSPGQRYFWTPAYVTAAGRPVADLNGSPAPVPGGATLETQAQADQHRDASIRSWNSIQQWLDAKGFFKAWGYTPTTASALTDRATYEAALIGTNPPAQYLPDYNNTVYSYGATAPSGLSVTADNESKGYEFELTANPTPNWRIAFNASETEAVRTNVGGAELDALVAYLDQQMAGFAGDMRQFNGNYVPTNEIRQNWASWRGQYTLLKLQEGAAASELRKWRYNVVTNYSFSRGFLKGVGVGGSYRWQDKVVIGYPVIPGANNLASFDLSRPYYGPSEDSVDAWFSYSHKLTQKINWKIQLNLRNIFGKEELIPISVQPDGQTWASARIAPDKEWTVTNTFSF